MPSLPLAGLISVFTVGDMEGSFYRAKRISKQGCNTCTVTIPSRWATSNSRGWKLDGADLW